MGIAHADPPSGYYDSADSRGAAVLRSTLHDIVDDHTRYPYTSSATDTWDVLDTADQDPLDSTRILDVYKNLSLPKNGGGGGGYNREHAWPKSYGFPDDGSENYPFSDCHHLFLSEEDYNSSRHNKLYGNCDASCSERPTLAYAGAGGGSGVYPGESNWTQTGIWETWSGRRGDVARALFYMDVRYEGGNHGLTAHAEPDLILTDDLASVVETGVNANSAYMGLLSVLLQWHEDDPVDEIERDRNDVIESFQQNRNPFIDHPEWVSCVFEDQCSGGVGPVDSIFPWINEIHYDNQGADTGEGFEIAGLAGTDLAGWTVVLYRDPGESYRTIALTGVLSDAGSGYGFAWFEEAAIQNGPADGLALVHPGGTVEEFLVYEGSLVAADGPANGQVAAPLGAAETSATLVGDSLQRAGAGDRGSDFIFAPPGPATPAAVNLGQSFASVVEIPALLPWARWVGSVLMAVGGSMALLWRSAARKSTGRSRPGASLSH